MPEDDRTAATTTDVAHQTPPRKADREEKVDLEDLGVRMGTLLVSVFKGIRDAAEEVIAEASRPGRTPTGADIEKSVSSLMEKIISQDRASELFRQGYDQGVRDAAKSKPPNLCPLHSDCFDLGYQMGQLAGAGASGDQTAAVAADWALGVVLKNSFLLR